METLKTDTLLTASMDQGFVVVLLHNVSKSLCFSNLYVATKRMIVNAIHEVFSSFSALDSYLATTSRLDQLALQGMRREHCAGLHCPPCCWYDDTGMIVVQMFYKWSTCMIYGWYNDSVVLSTMYLIWWGPVASLPITLFKTLLMEMRVRNYIFVVDWYPCS